ncbi:unnamed protein product [Microthlaspi erraticum]|uniref:GDSL esterase/lipase n=1 Tax=Microthlaspi erraticum TaxID=1685480 RepID=A0A6D2IFV5_9BRAS|nr:unnamed protein product [Microthlaspi erraticum]
MRARNTTFLTLFPLFLSLLRLHSVPGLEAVAGKSGSIPGLYVFGDSLVDAGNNNYLPISLAKSNFPPHGIDFPKKQSTGRFCNGKNAADIIAENFGLPLPPPFLSLRGLLKWKKRESAALTGVNFASAGAGIFYSTVQFPKIHETGASKFLIIGAAQIGCAPKKREKNSTIHECNKDANMLASLYNEALVKMLQQLKEELRSSMTYSYFDMFKSIHDIISNPGRYGFSDVTSACCGFGKLNAELLCLPFANVCPDRTKYLFWDLFGHPTEAAARTVVDLMLTGGSQYSSPLTVTQLVSS